MHTEDKNIRNIINRKYFLFAIVILVCYGGSRFILNPNLFLIALFVLGLLFYFRAYAILLVAPILISKLPSVVEVGGGTEVRVIYVILLLALWIIVVEGLLRDAKRGVGANRCLVLFFLIVAANYFRNPGLPQIITGHSSAGFIQFGYLMSSLSFFAVYWITPFIIKTPKQIKNIVWAFFAFACVGLLCAYLGRFLGIYTPFVSGFGGKVLEWESHFGSFSRYGWLGNYSIILLPIVLFFLKQGWIKITGLGILFVSIVLSGGRAHFVGYFFVIGIYLWLTRGTIKTILSFGAILLVVYSVLSYSPLLDRFPQLYRFTGHYTQGSLATISGMKGTRLWIWMRSMDMVKEHPIFGAGPVTGAERVAIKEGLMGGGEILAEIREGSHATYFNIPAIYGLPALLLYLVAVGGILVNLIKTYGTAEDTNKKYCLWLILVLAGFLMSSLFGGNARGGNIYIYFILGLADTMFLLSSKYKKTDGEIANQRLTVQN